MDFYRVVTVEKKDGSLQLRPDWKVGRSTDLMTRERSFYAIWDEKKKLWSTDINDVARLVDEDLMRHKQELEARDGMPYRVATMEAYSTKLWDEFNRYVRNSGHNAHNLDENLVFADTEVKKTDYASKRLSYPLMEGNHDSWDTLVSVLYNDAERAKIEWAIGAVVSGDSKALQKFLVFYGPPGSGKGTVLNIIGWLFHGYTTAFNAKELTSNNNSFASSVFKDNPLVGIQQDGDLSRIADNTVLNSIVSHETLPVNEKYKASYPMRMNAMLFLGTNAPVKITDAKSGIIRRLIDVVPTGQQIEHDQYHILMDRVYRNELGAIAHHCLTRYKAMGKNFYSAYRPEEMMLQTDVFYNYVEQNFDRFKEHDGVSLQRAWSLYKEYCAETGIDKLLPQYKFREELKNYFYEFEHRAKVDGAIVRSYFRGFKHLEPKPPPLEMPLKPEGVYEIVLEDGSSILDEVFATQPAQQANEFGVPPKPWAAASTTLQDINVNELHYVKVPENLVVIDFDIRNAAGEKDLELNLEAASQWPPTYAETSKSGQGIHLHYTYLGDTTELKKEYAEGIEVLAFHGGASLRRRLTKCNNINIMPLEDRLPKKEKSLLGPKSIQSEKGLRHQIERNLRKEIHGHTKPSIDFIHKILEEAYEQGLAYDVEDMRKAILTFAMMSQNQSEACVKMVDDMKFVGKNSMEEVDSRRDEGLDDVPILFYDIEVYPNLFVLCWKAEGSDAVVRMINPTSDQIEPLLTKKLVGFNNRRYDNHILYAAYLGESNADLYRRSAAIIAGGNNRNAYFGEAYNLSYADIYDFSSKKQGLKKWELELDIHHQELDIPWDKPVPKEQWKRVEEYCVNDVLATEAVWKHLGQDFAARQILAELSGLTVNHTTQAHTAKIIFGNDKDAQNAFVYTKLEEQFVGYHFDGKTSTYRGEVVGEGGYVYAEPGAYKNVVVLDVASMHPTSIVELNAFGPYTPRFKDLLDARLAIKSRNYELASTLLDGKLAKFLTGSDEDAEKLSYALKIVINIVYGLTSAKFPNAFRDERNKDNIVAKRGALFMIDLKNYVQSLGIPVIHIKTDSIKIPHVPDHPDIIDLIVEFGRQWGYEFEHDATYTKFCLINDAVYIAFDKDKEKWVAVGAQFQHPYVFKTLFSKEKLEFSDYCETKNVLKGSMYLHFERDVPAVNQKGEKVPPIPVEQMIHVGRTGSFVPVLTGGGDLYRVHEVQQVSVSGTKGHKWITREMAQSRQANQDLIVDMVYFEELVQKAKDAVAEHEPSHDFEEFVS